MVCVVVLDRRTEKNASTGLFELAYRQPPVSVPSYIGANLIIEGQVIKKPNTDNVAGRKTTNDGSLLHVSRDGNSLQNKVRSTNGVDETSSSTHRMKPVDVGAVVVPRAAQNRNASLTKTSSVDASSVCESKTRRKLAYTVSVDSALNAAQEKLGGLRGARDVRGRGGGDEQKCATGVARRLHGVARNRELCNAESSDSDSEPARAWARSKITKTAAVATNAKSSASPTFKRSAVAERRRSTVPLGETVSLGLQQPPPLTTTSGKRRKATRPGAARPRRHHRSKVVDETVHRRRAASYPEIESPASDHQGHGPSTPPPSDDNDSCVDVIHRATTKEPPIRPTFCRARGISSASKRTATTKQAAATCSVTFTTPATPGCTIRQSERRRTPSFHDVIRSQPSSSSTVKLPPSVAAVHPSVAVSIPAKFHAETSRLTTTALRPLTLLPSSSSSFPARRIGTSSGRLTLPTDLLRHSHGSAAAAALRCLMSPASRSVLMSAGDFSDLQASMQVIGLGNNV